MALNSLFWEYFCSVLSSSDETEAYSQSLNSLFWEYFCSVGKRYVRCYLGPKYYLSILFFESISVAEKLNEIRKLKRELDSQFSFLRVFL